MEDPALGALDRRGAGAGRRRARARAERHRRRARRAGAARRRRPSALGLEVDLHEHDLAALRAHPGHPGEEAPRDSLWGLTATLPGRAPGRLCLNGHVDVVGPGNEAWRLGPWSGAIEDGRLHGRGALDMKGAVVAAHARAWRRCGTSSAPEVVLQAVSSEEDGGLGTFAALERDARVRRRAAARADRAPGRLRAGGRADVPRRRSRPRRARGGAARGRARRSTATCASTPRCRRTRRRSTRRSRIR